MSETKQKLIILTGPTGVGKTKISISLAKALNGEIISADSMQVYKGMDIGSAKIREEEMQGVRHHLIDILDPRDDFNVVIFQKLAAEAIDDITSRGKMPIVVGGTGFYIQALRKGVEFSEEEDSTIREELEEEAERIGKEALHEKLLAVDPKSYERIPAGNVKRVVRALEFYQMHGYPISDHNDTEKQKGSIYDDLCFILTNERSILYDAINRRVDQMVEEGLFEEIGRLHESGLTKEYNSMQGIGYKEILAYYTGEISREDAIELVKKNTRHFAKRQYTFFKSLPDVIIYDKSQYDSDDQIAENMINTVVEHYTARQTGAAAAYGE